MSDLFLGFYVGVFFIILLFNLLSYIYYKEKSYLYYFFMHLGVVFLALDIYDIYNTNIILLTIATVFFSFLFAKEFLNLRVYYVKIDNIIMKIAIGISCVFLALYFTNNFIYLKLFPFSTIFLGLVIISIKVSQKGFALAKYFIIAWGVNFVIIFLSDVNRIFEVQLINIDNLSQIGNIFEATILSFALFAKTKILMDEQNEKEKMLIHQSRLASMGEMLSNISHQWRQPLNRVASFIMNMQLHIMDKPTTEPFLLQKLQESQDQLEYMSTTIDDFTNFNKIDKKKEKFFVSQSIYSANNIIGSSLSTKNIILEIEIIEDFELNSYPKELSQVLLNIMQNAKDALLENNIEEPIIKIFVQNKEIIIQDNALGIDNAIKEKIFDPYFTTKENNKGTGLGLYMSRMILEKNMNASILAKNYKQGVSFIIQFK